MIKTRHLLLSLLLVFAAVASGVTDPELKECKHQCKVPQKLDEGQRRACLQECERFHHEKQQRERDQGKGRGSNERYQGIEQEEEHQQGQQGQQQEENPYVFEEQHFTTKIQTQHGRVRALPKFTERSKLLKGIENYRLSILEAEPNTFILPNHWDAETVFFVASGMS